MIHEIPAHLKKLLNISQQHQNLKQLTQCFWYDPCQLKRCQCNGPAERQEGERWRVLEMFSSMQLLQHRLLGLTLEWIPLVLLSRSLVYLKDKTNKVVTQRRQQDKGLKHKVYWPWTCCSSHMTGRKKAGKKFGPAAYCKWGLSLAVPFLLRILLRQKKSTFQQTFPSTELLQLENKSIHFSANIVFNNCLFRICCNLPLASSLC